MEPFITYSRLPAGEAASLDAPPVRGPRREPNVGVMPLDRVPESAFLARAIPANSDSPFDETLVDDEAPRPRRRSRAARVIVLAGLFAMLTGVGVLAGTVVIVMTASPRTGEVASAPTAVSAPADIATTPSPEAAAPLAAMPAEPDAATGIGSGLDQPPPQTASVSPAAPAPVAPQNPPPQGNATDGQGWAAPPPPPPPSADGHTFSDDAWYGEQQQQPGHVPSVSDDLDFSSLKAPAGSADADELVARGRATDPNDPSAASGDDEGWATIPNEPDAYAVPSVGGLAPNGEMYVGTGNKGWQTPPPAAATDADGELVPVPPADIPTGGQLKSSTGLFSRPKG